MKNLINILTRNFPLKFERVLFIIFIIILRTNLSAQPALTIYADASKNILCDKATLRSVFLGAYKFGNCQIGTALRTNLVNGNNTIMSGYLVDGSREFRYKTFLLTINGFWLWIAPSQIMKETDYGCFVSMKLEHFEIKIGTSFRTYSFRKKAIDDYSIENGDTKIHESFNMIYSFVYNVRPSLNRWNAGVTLTNNDYFLINQETNPYMNVHFTYKVSSPVCLFAEAWYKNAGFLNMSINYFGYAVKVGLIWKIK